MLNERPKTAFAGAQTSFGLLAVGDIDQCFDCTDGLTLRINQWRRRKGKPDAAAAHVRKVVFGFKTVRDDPAGMKFSAVIQVELIVAETTEHQIRHHRAGRVIKGAPRLTRPNHLVSRVAGDNFTGQIPMRHDVVGVDGKNRHRQVGKDLPQPILNRQRTCFTLFTGRNVTHCRDDVILITEHTLTQRDFDPEGLAVLAPGLPVKELRAFGVNLAQPLPRFVAGIRRTAQTELIDQEIAGLVRRVTVQLGKTTIDIDNPATIGVVQKNGFVAVVKAITEECRFGFGLFLSQTRPLPCKGAEGGHGNQDGNKERHRRPALKCGSTAPAETFKKATCLMSMMQANGRIGYSWRLQKSKEKAWPPFNCGTPWCGTKSA